MEQAVATLLLIFSAAALSLQADFATDRTGPCKHGSESAKKPTANDWESAECEYRSLDRRALIDAVMDACSIIIDSSSNIHPRLMGPEGKNLWATVGLYGGSLAPSGHMQLSDVHYSVAASVSVFQTFLRPLGLALTEETVREVVRREAGTVRRELSEIYSKLAIAAKKTYQLVKNDANIHQCIVPHLPANMNATLRPSHPEQDSIPRHILIVDGLLNELQALAISMRLLLNCMISETGSCNF